jgi:predicted Zn-dependent protease
MTHPLEAFVVQRREHIGQRGPMAIDAILGVASCTKCDGVTVFAIGSNPRPAYESLADFVRTAGEHGSEIAGGAPARSCPCGGKITPSAVEYYAFHSGLERDVVGVWKPKTSFFGKSSVDLFVWDPFATSVREMSPLGELSPAEEERFVREALFRLVWLSFEENAAEGPKLVEALAEEYPSDPLLLRLLPILLQRSHLQLAASVADRYRKARPEDADGHASFGELLFTGIAHGVEPRSRLDEARSAINAALALAPDHREAGMALGNLFMLDGRLDDAKAAFLDLVKRHPEYAAAHFNLAGLLLEHEPATALVHFQSGERLASADPDYPVGCARALLALARKGEAAEALKRARNLTSAHPRFAELDASLGGP